MKYLFLDIDGVLNSDMSLPVRGIRNAGSLKRDLVIAGAVDPLWQHESVELLRKAQEAVGFKIVISSTWRMSMSVQDFHSLFDFFEWNTRSIVIGKTDEESGIRGEQIKRWLNNHGKYPCRYCILDDSSDMLPEQLPFFVRTTWQEGLNTESFEQILRVFEN